MLLTLYNAGIVTISPSPRAAICNVGEELEVICNTTENFLTWSLTFIDPITRTLSSTIQNPEVVVINYTVFTFSRISRLGSIPLVSNLVISSVGQGLNGTRIACMEVGGSATMATTTVHIIGDGGFNNQYLYCSMYSCISSSFYCDFMALNVQY